MDSFVYEVAFVTICIAANLGFGTMNRGRLPAGVVVLLASTAAVLLYQCLGYFLLGYRDPLSEIAAFIEMMLSLAIGAATLWLMGILKRRK